MTVLLIITFLVVGKNTVVQIYEQSVDFFLDFFFM